MNRHLELEDWCGVVVEIGNPGYEPKPLTLRGHGPTKVAVDMQYNPAAFGPKPTGKTVIHRNRELDLT